MKKLRKLALMLGIIIVLVMYVVIMRGNTKKVEDIEFKTYIVKANDTIWGIAVKNANGKNINEVVYTIRKDNSIGNVGTLQIGQKLLIREVY